MRHREATRYATAGGYIEHAAGCAFVRAPAGRFIRLGHDRDESRPTVIHCKSVEMAAVFAGEVRDERRPPARHEAVAFVKRSETGKERVDDPQIAVGTPSHFVAVNAPCNS